MRNRVRRAAPLLAALLLLLPATAEAAPVGLTVRIEGATRTLFEGPILSDGHEIRASSDSQARPCDGTNGGAHPDPGPTPTAAAVDAMDLIGQGFDGRWYAGYEDYLIERWGPDGEDPQASAYWGLLVNGVLTPVGGCQLRATEADQVLWAYDAFGGRSLLRLAAADDPSPAPAPPDPIASVEVGQPLELLVESYSGSEGEEPEVDPAAGVTVAPVATEAGSGYQTVEVASPLATTTTAGGTASVSFDSTGWWRLKAQEEDAYVRSNRLDVCVEPVGGGGCGPPPADAQLRIPARYLEPEPPAGPPGPGAPSGGPPAADGIGEPSLRLGRVRLDRRSGGATVVAAVSGPGRLRLSGRGVRPFGSWATAAGKVVLKVRPARGAIEALRRAGRFAVSLRVAFSTGGTTLVKTRGLVLKMGGTGR